MTNADYVTPEEHINFLVIEHFQDNTALYIINENLNENDLNLLEEWKSKLLNALIKLPNLNRATGGNMNQNCSIIGEIKIEDTHLYNKENEKNGYKLTLNTNLYKELHDNGILHLQDYASNYNAPSILLSERIIRANEKAKSIIEACNQKIKEINFNKSNIPYNDVCYFNEGIIYFSGKVSDFTRILILKTNFHAKFLDLVDILGNEVHFYQISKKLKDTKVKYNYKRYKNEEKEGNIDLDPDLINITNRCIDKVLDLRLNQNSQT